MNWIKNRKTQIEGIWCVLGGGFFSMLPRFFASGSPSARTFTVEGWWERLTDGFRYGVLDEFLLGFFVTLILIWSIKVYRSLP